MKDKFRDKLVIASKVHQNLIKISTYVFDICRDDDEFKSS